MCVYHFSASGYVQEAYEFCADDAAAEDTAFRICMELLASSDRLILITGDERRRQRDRARAATIDGRIELSVARKALIVPCLPRPGP